MTPENTASQNPSCPLVSVIVPCYNSERTIRQCLQSILNQHTSISYDVLVVDSSTDRTAEIVRQEFPFVRLIHLEKRAFSSTARNIGIRATEAPFCWMIDSDCIASPDEIERMVSRHHEAEYAAVAGSLLNGTPRSLSGWVSYLIEFKEFMPTMPKRLDWKVPTANIVYRTEVLRRYGYFDTDVPMGEDLLFHWKLSSGGERILFDPAIEATHLNRTGWKKVLFYQVDLGWYSAAARRRGGLPGQILLRHPSLILIMPFVRFKNALKWFALHDWRTLGVFLLVSPMYLLAASFWSVGFYRGVKSEGQRSSA